MYFKCAIVFYTCRCVLGVESEHTCMHAHTHTCTHTHTHTHTHAQGVIPLGGCDVTEAVSGPQKFAIKITHAHFKVMCHKHVHVHVHGNVQHMYM